MNTAVIPVSRLPLPSWLRLTTRLADFVSLTKPRVMSLAIFTALVGLAIAPGRLDALLGSIAILAIAAGAGAAGALNMWYEADIDAVMPRTARRPIPRGRISRAEALVFGLVLAGGAVAVLALALNVVAAALLAFTIFFYVVVYTMWLKRQTPQNIVIGGAAGALPPVIGWAAATGDIGLEPLVLFLIIFLWTPPHFWALSLNRADEYARANVPMLPVVAGKAVTKTQILIYSVLLLPISMLPWALGFAGTIYAVTAVVSGAVFVALALRLRSSSSAERRDASRLFVFSIFYLFVLFAALLADHSADRRSPTSSAQTVSTSVHAAEV
jgi:heme o synthase